MPLSHAPRRVFCTSTTTFSYGHYRSYSPRKNQQPWFRSRRCHRKGWLRSQFSNPRRQGFRSQQKQTSSTLSHSTLSASNARQRSLKQQMLLFPRSANSNWTSLWSLVRVVKRSDQSPRSTSTRNLPKKASRSTVMRLSSAAPSKHQVSRTLRSSFTLRLQPH